jgi:hypothetical protein
MVITKKGVAMNATVQKVLDLQKQLDDARKGAIDQLLTQQKDVSEQLKALGHDGKQSLKKSPGPKKPCSVCQANDHDGRFHKGSKATATPSEKRTNPAQSK